MSPKARGMEGGRLRVEAQFRERGKPLGWGSVWVVLCGERKPTKARGNPHCGKPGAAGEMGGRLARRLVLWRVEKYTAAGGDAAALGI